VAYTKWTSDWRDYPDVTTPITQAALEHIETGIFNAAATADAAIAKAIVDLKGDLLAASASDTPARLAVGANGLVLTADSVEATGMKWAAAATSVGYGTALPGSPVDGDEYILVDSTTAPTYSWRFRYVSAKASNKWIFIGGAPIRSGPSTQSGQLTTSFASVGTATISIPVSGLYVVTVGGRGEADGAYPSDMCILGYSGGGVTETDNESAWVYVGNGGNQDDPWFERTTFPTLTSGTAVQPKARARSSVNMRVDVVIVTVLPVAVGG
jgi:hypothetical protein